MPLLSIRHYILVFSAIVALILGVTYVLTNTTKSTGELFSMSEPSKSFLAEDEFVPIAFTFLPPSSLFGTFIDGNFWLVLTNSEKKETFVAPLYPREIPKLFVNDAMNVVRFGEELFPMDHTHEFSGYAYLSPATIFNGVYQAQVVFGRTEEGRSPKTLAMGPLFTIEVKREFQLSHSLQVGQVPTAIVKKGNEYPLMALNLRAAKEDISVRAIELGSPSVRRIPDAIRSLSLYDVVTGEKISTLTDTKIGAQTLEKYSVYVFDKPFVINSQHTRSFELRAEIDESLLESDRVISFTAPRMYGINTEKQKIAEPTPDIGVRVRLPSQ